MLMGIGTDRFVNLPIATAKRRCKSAVTWREIFQFLESGSNAGNGVYDSPFVHKTSKDSRINSNDHFHFHKL